MISSHSLDIQIDSLPEPLPVISAEVRQDDGWSPFTQATVVCPITDTAMLAALDPRTEHRATIDVRQEFGRTDRIRDISRRYQGGALAAVSAAFTGGPVQDISRSLFWHWSTPGAPYEAPDRLSLDLCLRSRDIDHASGTVTLELASDEALLADNAHLATNPHFVPASTVMEAAQYVVARVGGYIYVSSGETWTPFVPAENPWYPGVTAWEFIAPIVQAAGLRLWSTDPGWWVLSDHQIEPPGGSLALTTTGVDRSITQGRDVVSRDAEFYTAVIVTYEWANPGEPSQTAYDLARLPESITGTNQRVYTTTRRRPYPGPGAAKRILTTLLGRGRQITVTAVSDYAATPGRPVTAALPSTPLQSGIVSAVTWRFPADEMDVRLRSSVDAGPIETEYTPIPDPEEEP